MSDNEIDNLRKMIFGDVSIDTEAVAQYRETREAAASRWLAENSGIIKADTNVDAVYEHALSLERHAAYCAANKPCSKCPNYQAVGRLVYNEEFNMVVYVEKFCDKQRRVIQKQNVDNHISKCGVPKRFREARFSDFKHSDINSIAAALNGLKDGVGMFIVGKSGRGKTMLASIAVNGVIRHGEQAVMRTAVKLSDELKQFEKSRAERFAMIDAASVIAIDNLGDEVISGWWQSTLFDLVTFCDDEQRALIVTTADDSQFRKKYGDRMMNRIERITMRIEL